MTNTLIQIKIKQRLNKLASLDYDNIECWQVSEAFNKAQLEWFRRQIHGHNQGKEGDESTKMNIDDVQLMITDTGNTWGSTQYPLYYESDPLPSDYLYFKRISVDCISDCCPGPRPMITYLAQVGDVDNLLGDDFRSPSAEWGETICTISNNRIKIYTNGEFNLGIPTLYYFRKPLDIEFNGCMNPSDGTIATLDVSCEFKDDIVEILIDEACSILAGDIESMNQYQREKQNATLNN
jgi:hypothetical protein